MNTPDRKTRPINLNPEPKQPSTRRDVGQIRRRLNFDDIEDEPVDRKNPLEEWQNSRNISRF